jgi:hypothetical protein
MSPRLTASIQARTSSTFSCDIALLRQPGGFEGFVSRRIFAATRDLAFADREDDSEDLIGLDTADLGASAHPFSRDHSVCTGVEQFDRIERELFERVDPFLDMRA